MKKVTAIFDIGKTNKKCFLFDETGRELHSASVQITEIRDDDGFPCDDLTAIERWIEQSLTRIMQDGRYQLTAVNFSTYGASFVHVGDNGRPVTPLYNYLKPFPPDLLHPFYDKYGGRSAFAKITASPSLGMLNSGLQLYWLKQRKPVVFQQIRWSLHLPQYFCYKLTGQAVSEFTSIGCHTGLWDFPKGAYHRWVPEEGINGVLPPIVSADTYFQKKLAGEPVKVGVGIHDSSAALLPYFRKDKGPFLLISTGTWSIALNPFSEDPLTDELVQNDCLNYMRPDGKAVRAARLFLGREHDEQVHHLRNRYRTQQHVHKSIAFSESIYARLQQKKLHCFDFKHLSQIKGGPPASITDHFTTFEEAYHQLMIELIAIQIAAAKRAIGTTRIKRIYIDGGFAENPIFVELLALHFVELEVIAAPEPRGSALGAALIGRWNHFTGQ